ncbi:bifunctional 5,10-methylenetetrahydrofolate dehydrogenase/5,10-methenyltetrahydrofolate cyclohydrolase [Collinsella intestinalis]|uniref:bifunctional 5,10-methylenetetrahydrofolate dehydrogenase/5,10-methenyltetrahydrofolate cyclohydrolase n=1 Tax=Collinsella intestinalis TaxID=147207 RepID=UPI00195DA75C|nr:bifunctional 5,10-methylenetetrahydrofolate dehydrogenase/5,10-methenyltetrahydrofolate cyclohydrolase [Collinsella intestinalis]MBM6941766.1 bifunctional 5,10-methylenetetrahydrofolate dehydrogenase/5,10-methenyltetrahydrofolate cyclohydrolase [Collinsella intestinalis]
MAELLRGAPIARALTDETAARAAKLRDAGACPRLVIVRVGEDPGDIAYERGALKRADAAGVAVEVEALAPDTAQGELMACIERINERADVHGCLIMRPLPAHLDEGSVSAALDPAKDVDGITPGSLYGVFAGRATGFAPCTAEAVVELLERSGVALSGARVCVVGRSLVIGRPVAMLLMGKNATVTICHTRTRDLDATCAGADIIVAAAGRAGTIGRGAVASGQVVVDVGINVDAAGNLVGDVAADEVEPVVAALTPVPGGVGAVTTAVLMKHVVDACERAARKG